MWVSSSLRFHSGQVGTLVSRSILVRRVREKPALLGEGGNATQPCSWLQYLLTPRGPSVDLAHSASAG